MRSDRDEETLAAPGVPGAEGTSGDTVMGTYIGAERRKPSAVDGAAAGSVEEVDQLLRQYGHDIPVPGADDDNGRYTEPAFIDRGGMGEVILVRDRLLQRTVAMKTLAPESAADPHLRARFLNEARITAKLRHPGIVAIHDLGQLSDGRLFLTMKLIEGKTIAHRIEVMHRQRVSGHERTRLLRRLVEVLVRVCETMAYAHSSGVIHRDIKPKNLMVGRFGEVQVVDWGLASRSDAPPEQSSDVPQSSGARSIREAELESQVRASSTPPEEPVADIAGTFCYMPPEQARGDELAIDAHSDVYALGAVLYHILTGQPPYASHLHPLGAVLDGPPRALSSYPRSDLRPMSLCAICEVAMAREPAERYADASELAQALQDWLDDNQRHQRADAIVRAADKHWNGDEGQEGIAALRRRAARTRRLAAKLLQDVRSFDPVYLKKPAWALADRADVLEQRAAVQEVHWQQKLRLALNEVSDHPLAHQRLAEYYRDRHRSAEERRNHELMARAQALLGDHDRGEHAAYLRGDSALSLVTEPADARVMIYRYVLRHRRLVTTRVRSGDRTPLVRLALEGGSYLLVLRASGYRRVRYPIHLPRGSAWPCSRPGEQEPHIIRLLRHDELAADDVYIPAGWFLSGGDPEAVESLPARRVWVDAMVMKRYPVTRGQYLQFLNDLVDQGRTEEARKHVPKRPFGHSEKASVPAWPLDATGHYQLDPAWESAQQARWPVTLVDWHDACAYARWLSQRTGFSWRLPSELEWEKAARGVDGRLLPWGDFFEPTFACVLDSHDEPLSPRPVDEHKRFRHDCSPYGVRGMAGNVRQWCLDAWQRNGPEIREDRLHPVAAEEGDELRSARGGAWTSSAARGRPACRFAGKPDFVFRGLGFRLVRSLDESHCL